MKLREILVNSDQLGEYDVVYAKKPWSLETSACVEQYLANETVTQQHKNDASFVYFLEASLIKDLRLQVEGAGKTLDEVLEIILYYAENDAFP